MSQDASSRTSQLKAVAGVARLLREMAEARVDVRGEMAVVRCRGELQGAIEVLAGEHVIASVVSHPSGHFGERCRGAEQAHGAAE
ncbi:MAG: hypothetical protein ABSG43_09390 [Solirubrobacteraceae bacterium]